MLQSLCLFEEVWEKKDSLLDHRVDLAHLSKKNKETFTRERVFWFLWVAQKLAPIFLICPAKDWFIKNLTNALVKHYCVYKVFYESVFSSWTNSKQRVNFRVSRRNQNIIPLVKVSLAEIRLEIFINRQPESIFLYS